MPTNALPGNLAFVVDSQHLYVYVDSTTGWVEVLPPSSSTGRKRRDTNQLHHETVAAREDQPSDSSFTSLWSTLQGLVGIDSKKRATSEEEPRTVDQDGPEVFAS